MNIGRRIYFDLATGNVIVDAGERSGHVAPTTIEQDIESYAALAERVRETIGVLELDFGQYAEDFATSNGVKVNISGEAPVLEFSYPDPNNPTNPPEIYRKPLSETVDELQKQQTDLMFELMIRGVL
ncbi:hypothetical protein MO973_19820 [Paenibacillus sp. TRM 82003]|nr:hypothetical protein [Paenibacillus sp. TRM 82003]